MGFLMGVSSGFSNPCGERKKVSLLLLTIGKNEERGNTNWSGVLQKE